MTSAQLNLKTVIWAALAAAIVSLIGEIILWIAFTDHFPEILFKDTQRAAAILLGPQILTFSAAFDFGIFCTAGATHFGLSFVYSFIFAYLTKLFPTRNPLLFGAGFGLLLFCVNMYGFTLAFPWFAEDRDWITLSAHILFGLILALVQKK